MSDNTIPDYPDAEIHVPEHMRRPNKEYYYFNSIRNQVIVFMSLFTNMKVVDFSENDETMNEPVTTKIDIVYAPRERKFIEQRYDSQVPSSRLDMKVPKFSVSIESLTYDQERALNYFRTRRIRQNGKQFNDRMPIPYNIGVSLDIYAKYEAHIHQIMENIVPFIAPYIIVRIKENVDILEHVPRELRIDFSGDVGREISVEWEDIERRMVKGRLEFTIKGWVYKPLSETPGPILNIPLRFFDSNALINEQDRPYIDFLLDKTEVSGPNWGG
jgi:hypothetical protein